MFRAQNIFRFLRRATYSASLLATLLLIALWIRSYYKRDVLFRVWSVAWPEESAHATRPARHPQDSPSGRSIVTTPYVTKPMPARHMVIHQWVFLSGRGSLELIRSSTEELEMPPPSPANLPFHLGWGHTADAPSTVIPPRTPDNWAKWGFGYHFEGRPNWTLLPVEESSWDKTFRWVKDWDSEIAALYWALPTPLAIILAFPLVRHALTAKSRRNHAQGLCPKCGYDLRAHHTGDRCPECGTPMANARPI